MDASMKIQTLQDSAGQQQQSNADIAQSNDHEWPDFQDCDDHYNKLEACSIQHLHGATNELEANNVHINNKPDLHDCDEQFSNFASFDNQHFPQLDGQKEEDEFDDFVSADQPDPHEACLQVPETENHLAEIMKTTFPLCVDVVESEENRSISSDLFESAESCEIWNHLQSINVGAFGFPDRWRESESFNLLLKSLKIDSRFVRVPREMFSNLGPILQPIPTCGIIAGPSQIIPQKAVIGTSYDPSTSTNPSDGVADYLPVLCTSFMDGTDPFTNFSTSSNLNHNDLDLFEQKYSQSSNKNSKTSNENEKDLISQLEDIILNDNVGAPKNVNNDNPSISASISEMLKTTTVNSSKSNETLQVLSAEALQILDELPRLSFMRAKVLMFPLPSTLDEVKDDHGD